MEAAGRNLLSSPPTFSQKTQLRNCSSSVLMLHEHAAPVLSSVPHAYLGRHVPASAIGPEQQFENQLQLHLVKEEKTSLIGGLWMLHPQNWKRMMLLIQSKI